MDFLDHLWPAKFKRYRDFAYRILLLILLAVLTKEGILQAIAGWNTETTALEMRWFWPYLSIPVGVSLMFFQMIWLILEDLVPACSGKRGSAS